MINGYHGNPVLYVVVPKGDVTAALRRLVNTNSQSPLTAALKCFDRPATSADNVDLYEPFPKQIGEVTYEIQPIAAKARDIPQYAGNRSISGNGSGIIFAYGKDIRVEHRIRSHRDGSPCTLVDKVSTGIDPVYLAVMSRERGDVLDRQESLMIYTEYPDTVQDHVLGPLSRERAVPLDVTVLGRKTIRIGDDDPRTADTKPRQITIVHTTGDTEKHGYLDEHAVVVDIVDTGGTMEGFGLYPLKLVGRSTPQFITTQRTEELHGKVVDLIERYLKRDLRIAKGRDPGMFTSRFKRREPRHSDLPRDYYLQLVQELAASDPLIAAEEAEEERLYRMAEERRRDLVAVD